MAAFAERNPVASCKSCRNCIEWAALICIQVNNGVRTPCLSWCKAIWWPARILPLRSHRTHAPNATEHFQSTVGSLQVPHPWPDLNKVYPQQADDTLHTNIRLSRRGRRKKNTSLILGTWWGWCPSPRLFFLSFYYVLIVLLLLLLPLWPLRRCELLPTLDCKTYMYLKRSSDAMVASDTLCTKHEPSYSYPFSCHCA